LEFAAARSDGDLKDYFEKHIGEEKNHDAILLQDLRALGVGDIPLNIEAVELAGAQYYLVGHVHPSALLGYMAALERESHDESVIGNLESEHGVELRCLRIHSKLDARHIVDLDAQIEGLPAELRSIANGNELYTASKINKYFSSVEV
jgi:hypothetical protein